MKQLSTASTGLLPPLATLLGGVLAQECLIAVTGKFSPLKQWVRFRLIFQGNHSLIPDIP